MAQGHAAWLPPERLPVVFHRPSVVVRADQRPADLFQGLKCFLFCFFTHTHVFLRGEEHVIKIQQFHTRFRQPIHDTGVTLERILLLKRHVSRRALLTPSFERVA